MKTAPIVFFIVTVWGLSAFSEIQPFPPHAVTLEPSFATAREAWDIQFIRAIDPDRLLHAFRVTAGLPSSAKPMEGWEAPGCGLRGHFTGHYLSAAAVLADRFHDAELLANLDRLVDGLDVCQKRMGKGYLSAFPEEEFDKLEQSGKGIWAPYYTWHKLIQGLLDVHLLTGNKKAYAIALGMADYIDVRMARLDRATIDRMMDTTAASPANEMGGMNDVLCQLYRVSDNPNHLRLGRLFEPGWFLNPLIRGEDRLSGLHANTHIALVNGFARAYENCRDLKYRDAAIRFWEMLMRDHAYANGSSSGPRPVVVTPTSKTAEHWGDPGQLAKTLWSPEIAESCVSHNTRRLAAALFRWTGDARYADADMNLFYNAVLPTQSPGTGRVVYHLPLGTPCAKKYLHNHDYVCCSGTGMEAFASLQAGIYYRDRGTVYVNRYIPSTLTWDDAGLQLLQAGDFPYTPFADLTVTAAPKEALTIKLLIPAWADGTEIRLNGKPLPNRPGTLSYATITRTWAEKDTIRVIFHPTFRIVHTPDNPAVAAIFHGPLMLAFETGEAVTLKGNREEVIRNLSVADRREAASEGKTGLAFKLKDGEKTYTLRPLMDIDTEPYCVYAAFAN